MSHQPNIKRISEVIALILRLMGGYIFAKTKLVKIVYLLDVIQARQGNKNFSTAIYKSYYYGPYSDDIDDAINLLTDFGYVEIGQESRFDGNTYYTFTLKDTPCFGELSQKEKNDISQDISQFRDIKLKQILEVVYSTKEYDNTQFGEEVKL
ncbi:MAG: hypothetical protein F6J86_46955 [Symploca sp. SIO1B1]|nr:hypothetical protein [Symploca sp. SIO1B1]